MEDIPEDILINIDNLIKEIDEELLILRNQIEIITTDYTVEFEKDFNSKESKNMNKKLLELYKKEKLLQDQKSALLDSV